MKAAAGLLLLLPLLPLCYCMQTSCDGRQNNTKCYGPSGGSVVFQLLNDTSTMDLVIWSKNNRKILEKYRGRYIFNELKNGSVISNETVTLNNLNWDDAGEYKLEINNLASGQQTGRWILQLMVQAPVSSVRMTSQCLSQGETKVSCHSVGGDSPFQYRWSLNGVTRDSSEKGSSSVTLEPGESGYVVCNVSNNVSVASRGQNISECVFMNCTLSNGTDISKWVPEGSDLKCFEATTTISSTVGKETSTTVSNKPSTNITTSGQTTSNTTDDPWYIKYMTVMVAVLFALLFLLFGAIVFVYVHKKRHIDKGQGFAQEEDGQELTYADVKILKGRRVPQQTVDQDVEYGQVKISNRPRHKAEPREEECVYAKVHVAR